MPHLTYVNGRYLPHRAAAVHVEDRGYQFADGVYEVLLVHRGVLIDLVEHLDRLDYSLGELRLARPMSRPALVFVMREVLRRNGLTDGTVYLQVTRGTAPRDHRFPTAAAKPGIVVVARRLKPLPPGYVTEGAAIVTRPDTRWLRCDIKSIALLPNALGKQQAVEAGAFETWFVDDDGFVTEGTSTNAWIVTRDGSLVTRPRSPAILAGVTRRVVLGIVATMGLRLQERPFTVAEIHGAAEAFLTSTTSMVLPVTSVDGAGVADGRPGPVTLALRKSYLEHLAGQGPGDPFPA